MQLKATSQEDNGKILYTIGHSTRTIEEFLEILKEYDIEILADVRGWPSSRRYPHFNRNELQGALAREGVQYTWLGESLGGFRHYGLGEASPNKGWRSKGFRNYADHALSEDFKRGIRELLSLEKSGKTAIMCAERYYWRCHRRIISDHLVALRVRVVHIMGIEEAEEHKLTRFAVVENGKVTYPPKKEG